MSAVTGLAAYHLNSIGDDAYRIFRDSRIAAITVQADPDPGRGGCSFTPDEGLMKGAPKPPASKAAPVTSPASPAAETTFSTADVVDFRSIPAVEIFGRRSLGRTRGWWRYPRMVRSRYYASTHKGSSQWQ